MENPFDPTSPIFGAMPSGAPEVQCQRCARLDEQIADVLAKAEQEQRELEDEQKERDELAREIKRDFRQGPHYTTHNPEGIRKRRENNARFLRLREAALRRKERNDGGVPEGLDHRVAHLLERARRCREVGAMDRSRNLLDIVASITEKGQPAVTPIHKLLPQSPAMWFKAGSTATQNNRSPQGTAPSNVVSTGNLGNHNIATEASVTMMIGQLSIADQQSAFPASHTRPSRVSKRRPRRSLYGSNDRGIPDMWHRSTRRLSANSGRFV